MSTFTRLLCVVPLLAFLAPVHAAAPAPGDIVVAGGSSVVSVDPRTGNQNLVSDDAKSVSAGGQALFAGGDLFGGIGREADGHLVVIQRRGNYDGPNPDPARLIRIDPATGAQSLIQGSDPDMTYSQLSLAIGPSGEIYFGTESTNPGTAIFKADPVSGAISIVTNAAKSLAAGGESLIDSPMGLWVDPDGTLWMLAEATGVVRVEPASGKMTVFSSNAISAARGGDALFVDPRALARLPNGDFLVVDDPGLNDTPHYGTSDAKLIRVNHVTGAQSLVSSNARSEAAGGKKLMYRPYAVAVEADGAILLTDLGATRVIRVDPASGAQSLVTFTGALAFSSAILVEPGAPALKRTTLRVTTAGVADGFVDATTPGQIDCGRAPQTDFNAAQPGAPNLPTTTHVTCSHDYVAGAVVTLTAHPGSGATFGGFSGGGCSGNGTSCVVTMDRAQKVTATFTGRTLTINRSGTGAGYVTSYPPALDCGWHLDHADACTVEYAAGQDVVLTGNPYPDSNSFGGFSGAGCTGTTCTVSMGADRTVGVSFGGTNPARTHLTVATGGTGVGFVYGAPEGVGLVPASIDCGNRVPERQSCDTDIGLDGQANNVQLVLRAYPRQGQRFAGWSLDCSGTDDCRLSMDLSHDVGATFEPDGPVQRKLTVASAGSGAGWVDSAPAGLDCGLNQPTRKACSRAFDDGTRIVIAAHALPGTFFAGFSGGGCGSAPVCELTLAQAQSVTANFEPATVGFAPLSANVREGRNLAIDLVLDAPCARRVVVTLALGGTASAGSDYTAPRLTVAFAPGVTTRRLHVPIADDVQTENAETILLNVISVQNAQVAPGAGTFTGHILASD